MGLMQRLVTYEITPSRWERGQSKACSFRDSFAFYLSRVVDLEIPAGAACRVVLVERYEYVD